LKIHDIVEFYWTLGRQNLSVYFFKRNNMTLNNWLMILIQQNFRALRVHLYYLTL